MHAETHHVVMSIIWTLDYGSDFLNLYPVDRIKDKKKKIGDQLG